VVRDAFVQRSAAAGLQTPLGQKITFSTSAAICDALTQ
jgi:hypothetical protein